VKLPTASALESVERCPSSWVLPRIDESSEAAETGTRLHEVLAFRVASLRGETPHKALSLSRNEAAWADMVLDLHPWLAGFASEVAYAWNHATSVTRCLGRNIRRGYVLGADEVAGTADYVTHQPTDGGAVEVVDLKTGQRVTPPDENAQLALLAVAAAGWHAASTVRVGILHAPLGRVPTVEWHEMGPLALLEAQVRVRAILEAVEAAKTKPSYSIGAWCGYCPARRSCPTQNQALRRMAEDPQAVAEDLTAGLVTPDVASLAYQRWRAMKAALSQVEAQLHAYAREVGPIPCGDGTLYGPRETTRSTIDGAKALPIAKTRFGEAAMEAFTVETTKAALSELASAHAPRGQKASAAKALLAELASAGAITTSVVVRFEEFESARVALPAAAGVSPSPAAPVLSTGEESQQ
jgi:hypothetical protein